MTHLDIAQLFLELSENLGAEQLSHLEMRNTETYSKGAIIIESATRCSTIAVWSNGCCDVDYLLPNGEVGFRHYEFATFSEALTVVLDETRLALLEAHS